MSDANCHDQDGHENVWLLLPWYVNGTLEAAERRLVDEHLVDCALCREELGRCRGLSAALRSGEESAPSPHPIQLARLLERVEASERGLDRDEDADGDAGDRAVPGAPGARGQTGERGGRGAGDHGEGERLEGDHEEGVRIGRAGQAGHAGRRVSPFAATPRSVRIVLAGQLAALLLLAVALAVRSPRLLQPAGSAQPFHLPVAAAPPAVYRTLSAPTGDEGAAVSRPQIRVVFAETATEKQIREVLLRARGRLVDGPSPLGTYILEIPAAAAAGSAGGGVLPGTAGAGASANPSARATPSYVAPPDSLALVLSYLRAQAIVRFAEPVAGASPTAVPGGGAGSSAAQRPPARTRPAEAGTAAGASAAPPP